MAYNRVIFTFTSQAENMAKTTSVYTGMVQPADGESLREFWKWTETKSEGNGVEVNGLHTRSAAGSTASYSVAVG
jgi:hypothetical protein